MITAGNHVHQSQKVSRLHNQIYNVVHKAGNSFVREVDVLDHISFSVQILVFCKIHRNEVSGNEVDELLVSSLEEVDLFDDFLMNLHAQIDGNSLGKIIYKFDQV